MRLCFLLLMYLCLSLSSRADSKHTDTLTIAAVGDIMMGSAYPNTKLLPKDDAQGSFGAVIEQLRKADLSIGNLEGVLLDEGQTNKCSRGGACYAFRMPERYALHLKDAGFDMMSVANNHSGDFGENGRVHTAKALSAAEIAFAGFSSHPYSLFVKNGIKYSLCAFAPNEGTVSLLNLDAAQKLISELKNISDIVIVYFHGGSEGAKHQHISRKTEYFYGQNRGNVYDFAHAAIDAGADLVLGSGPHVTRALDLYKNRFIAYSLGNFCTYGTFCLDGPSGLAPLLTIKVNKQGEFISAQTTSIKQIKNTHPQIDSNQGAFKLLKELTETDMPEAKLTFQDNGLIIPNKKK